MSVSESDCEDVSTAGAKDGQHLARSYRDTRYRLEYLGMGTGDG